MIIDARYDGKSIFEVEEELLRSEVDEVLLRGAAMYGCKLPISDFFANFLYEEVISFVMNFGYAELTFEEIVLAMRLNMVLNFRKINNLDLKNIKFEGETFNVAFLSQVLSLYSEIRENLNKRIKNQIDGYEF